MNNLMTTTNENRASLDRLAQMIEDAPSFDGELIPKQAIEPDPMRCSELTESQKKMAKGEIGEQLVRDLLEKQGWTVYATKTPGSHPFDILAFKPNGARIGVDVKTYPSRTIYPDTGINTAHFKKYQEYSRDSDTEFWIYFVDEVKGKIYGSSLHELEKPTTAKGNIYPFTLKCRTGSKRMWPVSSMETLGYIPESVCKQLKRLRQSNY